MTQMEVEPAPAPGLQCIYCMAPATEKCLVCSEPSTCLKHALEYDQNHNSHPL